MTPVPRLKGDFSIILNTFVSLGSGELVFDLRRTEHPISLKKKINFFRIFVAVKIHTRFEPCILVGFRYFRDHIDKFRLIHCTHID